MSRLLRRLLSESAIYGLGAAASQVVGIILIPIYTRELGPTNYGVLAVMNTTISLASMIAGFALAQPFFREYLAADATDAGRRRLLAVSLTLRFGLSVAAALVLLALAAPLGAALVDGPDGPGLLALVALIVLLDTVNIIPLSYLRAERRPRAYVLLALLRAVLGSTLIVILVVGAGLGVRGSLIGSAAAAAMTTAAGLAMLASNGRLQLGWDSGLARALLVYAAPLVPAAAAGWALSFVDRYLLLGLEGADAVGIYAAGYSIGLVINVLVAQPFSLMWGPVKWDIYRDDPAAPTSFGRILTAYMVTAGFAALIVSALATDVIRLLLTPSFVDARFVVPFTAFAYVLYGAYTLTATGLSVMARTGQIALTVAGAAAANVVLNLVLIPIIGLVGAAVATLVSYALLAVASAIVSDRAYPIAWEGRRVLAALSVGLGLAFAAVLGPDHIVWRLACVAAYPLLMLGLRLVRVAEARRLLGRRG
jgi:O-antigen/teichoic acid export membrane protein